MENVYLDLLAQANGTYDDYQSRAEQRKQETLQRLQAARAQEQQANYIAQRQIERSAPNMYAAQGYSGGPVATLDLQNRLAYENRRNETARSYDEQLNDIAASYEDWLFELQKERLANELNYKTLAAQAAEQAARASQSSDYYSDGGMPEVEVTYPSYLDNYTPPSSRNGSVTANTNNNYLNTYVPPSSRTTAKPEMRPDDYINAWSAQSSPKATYTAPKTTTTVSRYKQDRLR